MYLQKEVDKMMSNWKTMEKKPMKSITCRLTIVVNIISYNKLFSCTYKG